MEYSDLKSTTDHDAIYRGLAGLANRRKFRDVLLPVLRSQALLQERESLWPESDEAEGYDDKYRSRQKSERMGAELKSIGKPLRKEVEKVSEHQNNSNSGLALALGVLAVLLLSKQGEESFHADRISKAHDRPVHFDKPQRQQLAFLADAGATHITGDSSVNPVWQNVAELCLKGDDCATVWSTVSANIAASLAEECFDHASTKRHTASVVPQEISVWFRIIDPNGVSLCKRQIDFTAAFLPRRKHDCEWDYGEIRFPLSFQCFHRLSECMTKEPVRLQAAVICSSATVDVTIKDLQWSALICDAE